jgi:hypothetical protein
MTNDIKTGLHTANVRDPIPLPTGPSVMSFGHCLMTKLDVLLTHTLLTMQTSTPPKYFNSPPTSQISLSQSPLSPSPTTLNQGIPSQTHLLYLIAYIWTVVPIAPLHHIRISSSGMHLPAPTLSMVLIKMMWLFTVSDVATCHGPPITGIRSIYQHISAQMRQRPSYHLQMSFSPTIIFSAPGPSSHTIPQVRVM